MRNLAAGIQFNSFYVLQKHSYIIIIILAFVVAQNGRHGEKRHANLVKNPLKLR
jgi:hypothetical protein